MDAPTLACPNLFPDPHLLKSFALDNGFEGIEWTIRLSDLATGKAAEKRFLRAVSSLAPLSVRYHLFFPETELGSLNPRRARQAEDTYFSALDLISRAGGRHVTVHVGVGMESMEEVSWEKTIIGLSDLGRRAGACGIRVCLENLAWGWTSRPEIYEKLLRKTGLWGTLDIGHARVSPSVACKAFDFEDFVRPHRGRILGAHIYHEETEEGHVPPVGYNRLQRRLDELRKLPFCDWWLLELREEHALLQTRFFVMEYLMRTRLYAAV